MWQCSSKETPFHQRGEEIASVMKSRKVLFGTFIPPVSCWLNVSIHCGSHINSFYVRRMINFLPIHLHTPKMFSNHASGLLIFLCYKHIRKRNRFLSNECVRYVNQKEINSFPTNSINTILRLQLSNFRVIHCNPPTCLSCNTPLQPIYPQPTPNTITS